MAEDEVVGWLTSPRSAVYHLDQAHADALVGDGGLYPVTAAEVAKFDLVPCQRCSIPKDRVVPENVAATVKALRTMFVVEGTDAEIEQMARDFLDDLAEVGYRVTRIPQRKVPVDDETNTTDEQFDEMWDDATDVTLDFSQPQVWEEMDTILKQEEGEA